MSEDLTTAYLLGVEDMRSKLHKQADEIERLRAENEKLRHELITSSDAAKYYDYGYSCARDMQKDEITRLRAENEKLRKALEPFAEKYQDNGLTHSMYIFEMKHLLAAKKLLGETDE